MIQSSGCEMKCLWWLCESEIDDGVNSAGVVLAYTAISVGVACVFRRPLLPVVRPQSADVPT